jgi:hypothetical protein
MPEDNDSLPDLLQTPDNPESGYGEAEQHPDKRSHNKAVLLFIVVLFIPLVVLCCFLQDRPGGVQIAILVVYTASIPFLASDRFENSVPWDRITRRKFLLRHCAALGVVYGITTGALAAKPYLPDWFTIPDRKGSCFYWSLGIIFLFLASFESSWEDGRENKDASAVE